MCSALPAGNSTGDSSMRPLRKVLIALIWPLLPSSATVRADEPSPAVVLVRQALHEALAGVQKVKDPFERAQAWTRLAKAQLKAGERDEARKNLLLAVQAMPKIKHPIIRCWALDDIARVQTEAGDWEATDKTFVLATEAALSAEGDGNRAT